MNYFVAGTDTGVGKTAVTCGLLAALQARGRRVAGMKPVAAGTDTLGHHEDVEALRRWSSVPGLPAEALNPYLFAAPTSPHIAARHAGCSIEWAPLAAAYARLTEAVEMVLVEGAGGWRVPLSDDLLLSDLPRRLNLPVILVAGIRLGAINHTLLTVDAIRHDGCELRGWIANIVDPTYGYAEESIESLVSRIDAPCLARVPWLATPTPSSMRRQLTSAATALEDGGRFSRCPS